LRGYINWNKCSYNIPEESVLEKKQAAHQLIRHAVQISKEIMKEDEEEDDNKEGDHMEEAAPSEGKDDDLDNDQ